MIDLRKTGKENNQRLTIYAHTSNDDVLFILNQQLTGIVHSVFNHSFNVIFGERLIHIGPLENGLSPFGIGLSVADAAHVTRKVRQDQQVIWDQNKKELIIHDQTYISLKQVKSVNHLLEQSKINRDTLLRNAQFIKCKLLTEKWETGLATHSHGKEQFILKVMGEQSIPFPELTTLKLLVAGAELTAEEALETFNYWIGRGPGLTPSGDDMIVGICAVLSLYDHRGSPFLSLLQTFLHKHGEKRTTKVSLEYLSYAIDYKFHSHIASLAKELMGQEKAILFETMMKVGKLGHTSGTDTLIGMLLGIQMIVSAKTDV